MAMATSSHPSLSSSNSNPPPPLPYYSPPPLPPPPPSYTSPYHSYQTTLPPPPPKHSYHTPRPNPLALYIKIHNGFPQQQQQQQQQQGEGEGEEEEEEEIHVRCCSSYFHNSPLLSLLPTATFQHPVPQGGSEICVIKRPNTNITKTFFVCNPHVAPDLPLHGLRNCSWTVSHTGFLLHNIPPWSFTWDQIPPSRFEIWNAFSRKSADIHLQCWISHGQELFTGNLSRNQYWGHSIQLHERHLLFTCSISQYAVAGDQQPKYGYLDVWHLSSPGLPQGDCLWLITAEGFYLNGKYVSTWKT